MKKLLLLAGMLALLAGCRTQEKLSPVLTIEGGQVQGVLADNVKDVFVFRGIPYAAPPIRENRWKAPQPVVPWDGVYLAKRFGNPSYQHIQYKGGYYTEWGYGDEAPFSEDCLYVNVWTKKPGNTSAKLPVALWTSSSPSTAVSASTASWLIRFSPLKAPTVSPETMESST